MARRVLFTVTTPLGYDVMLTRNRWREIVRYKHPALKGCENEVQQCLEKPAVIRESAKDADTHLYYRTAERGYLRAVVGIDVNRDRFVVTGYFTENIKKGTELWTE